MMAHGRLDRSLPPVLTVVCCGSPRISHFPISWPLQFRHPFINGTCSSELRSVSTCTFLIQPKLRFCGRDSSLPPTLSYQFIRAISTLGSSRHTNLLFYKFSLRLFILLKHTIVKPRQSFSALHHFHRRLRFTIFSYPSDGFVFHSHSHGRRHASLLRRCTISGVVSKCRCYSTGLFSVQVSTHRFSVTGLRRELSAVSSSIVCVLSLPFRLSIVDLCSSVRGSRTFWEWRCLVWIFYRRICRSWFLRCLIGPLKRLM